MDGPTLEHSDSESGDSWTLLEHNPSYGDDAPDFMEHTSESRTENHEKDEDTDGISIISDSEPDSPSPCPMTNLYLPIENHPTEHEIPQCISAELPLSNINDHHESVREVDDFLSVHNIKHKTYVHRRNKRLSTVLNIIVLGSVITAAGVAIGHMWGAKTDCSIHTTPTVNKILSNLYKLQEENAYLRNKLKEITLNNYQIHVQKSSSKQNRCRKMFEESLNNDNINKLTKCLDDKFDNPDKLLNSHLVEPSYEKEFISDIDKLKNVYLQNKSWLDDEISQRLKQEEESLRNLKTKHISRQKINDEKDIKNKVILSEHEVTKQHAVNLEVKDGSVNEINDNNSKKISYADSLKSSENLKKMNKKDKSNKTYKLENKGMNNKKLKEDYNPTFDHSVSEEEIKKDNRYIAQKFKPEKKKHDRQKCHKKQKRKNKYEQWEMKGFMKDYDEISFASSQDTNFVSNNENFKYDIKENINHFKDNIDKYADTLDIKFITENDKEMYDKSHKKGNTNKVDSNWFDKRAIFRKEARKKLEKELFGESPNTAGWYFRRMYKREQCRAKGDNSTYRKLLKRNMNFKVKK